MPDLTDAEWLGAVPAAAEWVTPPGSRGGLFHPENKGGLRCRLSAPEDDGPPAPGDGYAFVEFWAAGGCWVPIAELRTWERY